MSAAGKRNNSDASDIDIELGDLHLSKTHDHDGLPSEIRDQVEANVQICCSHSSLYGLKFLSRIGVSASILLFSFTQIALHSQDDNSIYFSLISSILGYYIGQLDKQAN